MQAGYIAGSTTAFGGGNNTSTGGGGNAGNPLSFASNVIDAHRLAGISDHSFNVVGLYERGPIAARLAYSWRSEFLTANLDCCIGLPMWQDDSGYLDGSVRYQINDGLEVSLDVSNILDTTAVMQQQVFGDCTGQPRRQAGEDRFGLDAQRSPLPARRPLQVLNEETCPPEGAPWRELRCGAPSSSRAT